MSANIPSNSGGMAEEEPPVDAATANMEKTQTQNLPAQEKKLGIALVGLGTYSTEQVGPALTETSYCHLAGVVSGDVEKGEEWRLKYNLKKKDLYNYENFDEIRSNRDIDIVYIAVPNALHAEFTIRAARAGKHVICEKPMATNVEDCHRMIEACRQAGVKLSIGYRLHFDPFHQEMMRLGQNKVLGTINRVVCRHGREVGSRDQWRVDKTLAGGGPLMDLGIYCAQAALYTVGELPVAVTARFQMKTDREKFRSVEEGIEWEMTFAEGTRAICECSYAWEDDLLRAEAANGWFELQPAYAYYGLKGTTPDGPMTITSLNQQAAQMDDFSRCIQNDMPTRVPGEMGLRDVKILQAIYESAGSGKTVELQLQEFHNLIEI